MRLSSPPQRTASLPRGLTAADHAKAARLSREMALYSRLQGGSPTPPRAPLKVGSPAFVQAAKKDYADLLELYGAPRLSPAFVVQKVDALAAPVRDSFERFRAQHAGKAELAVSTIDGQPTYQAQVLQPGGAQVLLMDGKGAELARGVARGASVQWR